MSSKPPRKRRQRDAQGRGGFPRRLTGSQTRVLYSHERVPNARDQTCSEQVCEGTGDERRSWWATASTSRPGGPGTPSV